MDTYRVYSVPKGCGLNVCKFAIGVDVAILSEKSSSFLFVQTLVVIWITVLHLNKNH